MRKKDRNTLWLCYLMCDISMFNGGDPPTTELFLDNTAAITITREAHFHGWSWHISTHFHFMCEHVEDGTFNITHVPTAKCLPMDSQNHSHDNHMKPCLPVSHYLLSEGVCWRTDCRLVQLPLLCTYTIFPFSVITADLHDMCPLLPSSLVPLWLEVSNCLISLLYSLLTYCSIWHTYIRCSSVLYHYNWSIWHTHISHAESQTG